MAASSGPPAARLTARARLGGGMRRAEISRSHNPMTSLTALFRPRIGLFSLRNAKRSWRAGSASGETEARRILYPDHATSLERLETALATLGQRLVIGVDQAT